jgi:hypothetical protein
MQQTLKGCNLVGAAGAPSGAGSTHLGDSLGAADDRRPSQRGHDNSFGCIPGSALRPQEANRRPDQADLGLVLGGIPGEEDLYVIVRHITIHSPPPLGDPIDLGAIFA